MGCVHIYCGEGKGKTTAAVGLAVRMAGRGRRVIIARFLKSENSGEVDVLRRIEGITVLACEKSFGFTWQMSEAEKAEAAEYYGTLFEKACRQAVMASGTDEGAETEIKSGDGELEAVYAKEDEGQSGSCRVLLVLDELCAAVSSGFIEEQRVIDFLDTRPGNLEVVMTGRDPAKALFERADYVSEIKKRKHPFDYGQGAREGIEY